MSSLFFFLLGVFIFVFSALPAHADSILKTTIAIPNGAHPYDVAVDSVRHRAYLTTLSPNEVYVIDTLTDSIINSVPLNGVAYGVAVDSSKNKIYVSNYDANTISVIDGNTYAITNTISGLLSRPQVMAVHEIADRLYVANDLGPGPSTVTIINTSTEAVLGTIPAGNGPFGLAVNFLTNRLYITSAGSSPAFQVIDTTTNNVVATLDLNLSVQSVAVDTSLNRVYVVNQFGNSVYAIDGQSNTILASINLNTQYAVNPIGLAVDSVLHKAYTGNHSGSNFGASVSILDTSSNILVQTLQVGQTLDSFRNVVYVDLDTTLHKVYAAMYNASSIAVISEDNISPVIGAMTATANPVQVGITTSVNALLTDPDAGNTHTATWNWGDGTTAETVTVVPGNISRSHTYATAGVYTVTLVVSDGLASDTEELNYISVYDPTPQGLFSAGQRFDSPIGAYIANPSLTGNVMFGLSYKYQGDMPVGNRQFSMDFNAANFEFNATSISSLVIANGVGTLMGTGTVNGQGVYNFLVVGKEGLDTIRIKITDQASNIIYDTQPGAPDTAVPATFVTAGNILAN